ncbi:hypothetical protein [Paenibacillus luteus]|uniref:hypothetical protein n=1 Tax=Paenibacillus luteus TaxID=2545753 RepID=UPI00114413EF|nr:hypothetical protein [Paenibacillus luteus]
MRKYLFVNPAVIVAMVIYLIILSFFLTMIVCFSAEINLWIRIVVLTIWYSIAISFFYFVGINKKVIISEKGIEFKSFKRNINLTWEEIEEVGFVYYSPVSGRQTAKFICFSKVTNSTQIRISKFSNDCIYMKNRKGLVPYLSTFWPKEIGG